MIVSDCPHTHTHTHTLARAHTRARACSSSKQDFDHHQNRHRHHMMWMILSLFFLLLLLPPVFGVVKAVVDDDNSDIQPEQIHLSLGPNPNQMVITWITQALPPSPSYTVWYGIEKLNLTSIGNDASTTFFVDNGPARRSMYIHRVMLQNLLPNTTYQYQVGSSKSISSLYRFRTFPTGTNWSPRFVVYGDLGNVNSAALQQLQQEVTQNRYDALLHIGDLAYDLHTDDARNGDEFMRKIQPIAAHLPYQVCAGNHEQENNFSNYDARFTMYSEGPMDSTTTERSNHFWSYNIGPAHIVAFNTEFYIFTKYGTQQIVNQYQWLANDLAQASRMENRIIRPWIIVVGHRPFYSEYIDDPDTKVLRDALEDLFYQHNVDLLISGHMHIYERMWPIYRGVVRNGTTITESVYHNPAAPIQLITGSAGCKSELDEILPQLPYYNAKIIKQYGFTRLKVVNGTHLHLQQISAKHNGSVVDEFYIIKDSIKNFWT